MPRSRLPKQTVKTTDDEDETEAQARRTRMLCVVSFALLGIGLILVQVSVGRWLALSASAIALVIAIWSLTIRVRLLGLFASCSHAVFVSVLLFSPSWLGLRPLGGKDQQREQTVFAVGLDGTPTPASSGWVDMSTASWQLRDVRVRATIASVGPITLAGHTGKTRQSRDSYIVIRVHLGNVGAERELQVPQWVSIPGNVPRLRSSDGLEFRFSRFDDGWKPMQPSGNVIPPGRYVDVFLYFDAPINATQELQLELPGGALGLSENIRVKLAPFRAERR